MSDIPGWMADEELDWLAKEAAKAKIIVELGSWKGRSAACLAANTPGFVICVDHFSGLPGVGHYKEAYVPGGKEKVKGEFLANTQAFRDAGKLLLLEMSTDDGLKHLAPLLANTPADMVFIDADHSEKAVRRDISGSLPLLRPGGLICGHDYGQCGVDNAVNALLPPRDELGPCSIWYWRKG